MELFNCTFLLKVSMQNTVSTPHIPPLKMSLLLYEIPIDIYFTLPRYPYDKSTLGIFYLL